MLRRFVSICLLAPTLASAQQVAAPHISGAPAHAAARESANLRRVSGTVATAIRALQPPVIDGDDSDPVWASAQVIDHFRQYEPVEDGEPRFRTEARIAFDERNLYVFVRAFDPHPDSIVARLGRRDNFNGSDQIMVFVDGYHDRRTAFGFFVNPVGVKIDEYVYNDGNEDTSWDGVWDVATRIDSLGWTAEFRIPLSQIRYQRGQEHTFGIAIARQIARYQENVSWPLYRKSKGGIVSQFGDVIGIDGISSPRRLELAPYTVTKAYTAPTSSGYGNLGSARVGGDVKYGVTSNLTLDGTINPDFGQVEADPSVLNLSGFETFLSERRPFFLEGQGLFRFDVNCNNGNCSGLFYSRRIGRAPQLSGTYADSANPTATTILGAAKLTGQLANGVTLGILDATTARESTPERQTIEPQTNYFVGTTGREFRNGASSISGMITAVNRQQDAWTSPYLRHDAYSGGVQFHHQFWQRNFELSGYWAQSLVQGTAQAIAATQTDMVHDYQRPDGAVHYDSLRTSLAGNSAMLVLNKRGGDFTRLNIGYQYLSPGFEINDVGFLSRANSQFQFGWLQLQGNTPRGIYRNFRLNFNQWASWTTDGVRTGLGGNVNAHMTLRDMWSLHVGEGANLPSLCDNCARGGPLLYQPLSINGWAGISGDDRRSIVPNVFGFWFAGDGGRSGGAGVNPDVQFRLASRFNADVGMTFEHDLYDTQWNGNFGDYGSDTTHYTFARLDQKIVSMTTRVDFTATPTLSLQIYAQPFVTGGRYTNWREIASPRASDPSLRYRAYDGGDPGSFDFQQFRSNTVLRWEYRRGSVLYFVWSQGRTQSLSGTGLADFNARSDYRALFGQHPGNVFLIKGSYWMNL